MDLPPPALSLADEHAALVEQVGTRADAVLLAVEENRWPDVELRRLVDHLHYELLDQAGQEERLLFPLVGGCAAPRVRPLLAEHAALRTMTEQLGALAVEPGPDVDPLARGVRQLRRLLQRHVVEEERALATVTLDGVGTRGRPPWCRGWWGALEEPVLDLDVFPRESAEEAVVRRVTRLRSGDSVEIRSTRGPQVLRRAVHRTWPVDVRWTTHLAEGPEEWRVQAMRRLDG
ncbi:hemerythrin domain-containing protein [Geodermatophilus sp. SYSU D00703]